MKDSKGPVRYKPKDTAVNKENVQSFVKDYVEVRKRRKIKNEYTEK